MTTPPLLASRQLSALAGKLLDGRVCHDDLMQAAALAILRHRDRITAVENPGGLAYTIGSRAMLQYRRQEHRHHQLGDLGTDPRGREGDPADAAERADLIQRVRQAVGTLTPAQRRLVELRYLDDPRLTIRQAAKALGVTEDYVRYVERRALAALAAGLAGG